MNRQDNSGVADIAKTYKQWNYAILKNVSSLTYGENLPSSDMQPEGFPVYGANGQIGYHSKANILSETVLVSCRGEYSGTINLAPAYSYVTNNSIPIRLTTSNIETKFLYYALQLVPKARMVSGSAQPQVVINDLKNIAFDYPDIKIQKRISGILSIID
jgi:type I restriction enzyme, S subunit